MKELTTEPQPCIACHGAKRSSEDRGMDRGQPGDAGGLNAETNRAGTLCDHCGGTGLDPESLLGDWSDYGRAAVRWLIFEAPGDWSRDRCLQHVRDVWGDLTVLEIRFRTARERVAKESVGAAGSADCSGHWIDLQKHKPKPGSRVLACDENGYVCIQDVKDRAGRKTWIQSWKFGNGTNLTAWMPLPEWPKELCNDDADGEMP